MKTNTQSDHTSLNSSYHEKIFGQNLYRKSEHIFCDQKLFHPKIVPIVRKVYKYYTAAQATYGNTMRCMCTACWIHKATNTHSKFVIIIAFILQDRLHERVSILRYTYLITY
jgi:hypothetical protein